MRHLLEDRRFIRNIIKCKYSFLQLEVRLAEVLEAPVDNKDRPVNTTLNVSKVKVTVNTETNPIASYIPLEGTTSRTEGIMT